MLFLWLIYIARGDDVVSANVIFLHSNYILFNPRLTSRLSETAGKYTLAVTLVNPFTGSYGWPLIDWDET
jgi:hypothetical protein